MGSNIPFSASAQESSFFTPLMIPSLALWFDAADPGTITQSGGTVSEWRDKSSNAYSVFQPNASYRPTYGTNLLNGLPGVQLSGSRYLYQLGSNMPNFSSSPATTVYMVAKNGSTLAPLGWNFLNTMTYIGALSGTPRYFFSFYEENTPRLSLYTNDVLAGFNSSYFVPLNSNAIIGFAASATSNYLFFNGSNTAFTSTGAPPSANNETWFFFGDDNSNYVTDENIYEFVGFNTLLTSAQQQAVEGYLATKWGLQSSLSNGHPYKITPLPFAPTFVKSPPYPTSIVNNPQFDPRLIPGCQLWLDGQDLTTLFQNIAGTTPVTASSQVVQLWKDKSSTGNNATSSSSSMTYSQAGVYFPGTQTTGLSLSASQLPNGIADSTWFFVINATTSSTVVFMGAGSSGAGLRQFYLYNGNLQADKSGVGGISGTVAANTGSNVIFSCIQSQSTTTLTGWQNGAQFGTTSFTFNIGTTGATIGSVLGSYIYIGYVGEVLVYGATLSTTQRQQVEAYLAQKWKVSSLSSQNIYAPGSYLTFVNPPRIPALPMRRAVQNNKFNPTQISGCQLWLDAADASTFTYSSGSNITTWIDKSPGANNLTTLTGTPTYTTDGNLKIVNFKSGDLLRSAFTFTITTSSAFFVVAKLTSTSTSYPMVLALPDNNSGDYSIRYSGSVVNFGNSDDIGNGNYFTNGAPNTNASFLNQYVIIDTTTATRAASSRISVSGSFSGRYFIGNVAEVLVYPGGVNSTQRSQIQGYLGWKWGLKSQFPSDHPFFLIPPLPLS